MFIKYLFTEKLPILFDKNITENSKKTFQNIMIKLAIFSYLAHIVLVFLMNNIPALEVLHQLIPSNYLAAIYTPFSFIIIYEIFELVIIIPQSITSFISKQFEIVALIVIREVFKDFSHMHGMTLLENGMDIFKEVVSDLGAGLLLFLLVVIFNHINRYRERYPHSEEVMTYINVKKSISFILGLSLILLAAYSLFDWLYSGVVTLQAGETYHKPMKLVFFKDFFTVLVFVDIFLMIFSLIYTHSFDVIFRNSAYVISTVLIRMSLTTERPINHYIAFLAVVVGILSTLVFIYYNKVQHIKVEAKTE